MNYIDADADLPPILVLTFAGHRRHLADAIATFTTDALSFSAPECRKGKRHLIICDCPSLKYVCSCVCSCVAVVFVAVWGGGDGVWVQSSYLPISRCLGGPFFPLATNSHAQSRSPVSCRSKRVDDHSRFYANFRDIRGRILHLEFTQ